MSAQGSALGWMPKPIPSPEGATHGRGGIERPFRAPAGFATEPRALPWAGMDRTFGAHPKNGAHYASTPAASRFTAQSATAPQFTFWVKNQSASTFYSQWLWAFFGTPTPVFRFNGGKLKMLISARIWGG